MIGPCYINNVTTPQLQVQLKPLQVKTSEILIKAYVMVAYHFYEMYRTFYF